MYGRTFELDFLGAPTASHRLFEQPWGRFSHAALRSAFSPRVYVEPNSPLTSAATIIDAPWIYLDGYWQHEAVIESHHSLVKAAVGPLPGVSQEALAFSQDLANAGAVGIHVRSYNEERVASRRLTPSQGYYEHALQQLTSEFGDRPIFVTGDLASSASMVRTNALNFVDAAFPRGPRDDFHLLRSCKYHILCNSSFGWWAAFLADSQCVYYPVNTGYFHYARPLSSWRLLKDEPPF